MIKRIYILMLTVLLCVPFVQAGKLAPGDVFTVTTSPENLKSGKLNWKYVVNEDRQTVSVKEVTWTKAQDFNDFPANFDLVINDNVEYEGERYEVTGIISLDRWNSFSYSKRFRLRSLVIPSSITEYDPKAFTNVDCKEFRVNGKGGALTSKDGILLAADESLLVRYPILATVYPPIPETVREFADYAYCFCKQPLPVPEGVKEIPEGLYYHGKCALPLPNTVRKIGYRAFIWYDGLAVWIPEGVTEIGEEAFESLYTYDGDKRIDPSLRSIYIPASVKVIGRNAFQVPMYYSKGEELYYPGNTPWIVLADVDVPFSPLKTSEFRRIGQIGG